MQNKSEMINRIAELAEENVKLNAIIDSYQPRLQRYKDILQEIKEIAEYIMTSDTEKWTLDEPFKQIEKILELTKAEEEWK